MPCIHEIAFDVLMMQKCYTWFHLSPAIAMCMIICQMSCSLDPENAGISENPFGNKCLSVYLCALVLIFDCNAGIWYHEIVLCSAMLFGCNIVHW